MMRSRIPRLAVGLAGLLAVSGCTVPADRGLAGQAADDSGIFANGFGPAVDWSLTGRASTRVQADSNHLLRPGDPTPLLTTRLDTGLTLGATTKRADIDVNLGLSAPFYFGEEPPDTELPVDPSFSANGTYRGKRYTLAGTFSFDIQPTTFTQFEDTGILNNQTAQVSADYSASLAYELDRRNTLTVSTAGKVVDFLTGAPGLVPTRELSAGLGWNHELDARTGFGLDLSLEHFSSENAQATRSQTFGMAARFRQQRTRRHKFNLGAGVDLVRTEERGRDNRLDIGFKGSAGFNYSLRDIAVDLTLSQDIDPSATGELQGFTRLGAGLVWTINDRESLAFLNAFTRRTPFAGNTSTLQTLTTGATYSLALTREARFSLGYNFRARDDSVTGFASGHQFFVTFAHDFTFLP